MKTGKALLAVFLTAFLAVVPAVAFGAGEAHDDDIVVERGEVVNDSLIRVGRNIAIEGTVNGDAIIIGNKVEVSGQVLGDVIAVGRLVKISGDISGNVRIAASLVEITGRIARNANVFTSDADIGEKATIGKDLLVFGGMYDIKGEVGRHVKGRVVSSVLSGKTRGDVDLEAYKNLDLSPGAEIEGNLYYSSFQKTDIGEDVTIKEKILYKDELPILKNMAKPSYAVGRLVAFFGLLVSGLLVVLLLGKKSLSVTRQMLQRPASSFGFGVLVFALLPLVVLLLALSIVGLPLALIGFSAYMIFLYAAKVFVSIALGQKLLKAKWIERFVLGKKAGTGKEIKEGMVVILKIMAIGSLVYMVFTSLPVVGSLVSLLGVWWVLGGLVNLAKAGISGKKK